ncbi:MAG: hypothetical protein V1701_03295 [Planctomycetota bacterium]
MGKTGWLVFFMVVLAGGGINLANLIAVDQAASKDKITEVKEELLAKPEQTLSLQGCELSARVITRITKDAETDILKIAIKNPAKSEARIICKLRLVEDTSNPFSRMITSAPKTILMPEINVSAPAASTTENEIVVKTRPKAVITDTPKAAYPFYYAYVTMPGSGKQPENQKMLCSWQPGVTIKEASPDTMAAVVRVKK